jgi:hypothetical protein
VSGRSGVTRVGVPFSQGGAPLAGAPDGASTELGGARTRAKEARRVPDAEVRRRPWDSVSPAGLETEVPRPAGVMVGNAGATLAMPCVSV